MEILILDEKGKFYNTDIASPSQIKEIMEEKMDRTLD
jgi:hypothetical protein